MDSINALNALKKELARTRSKCRILQACLRLNCRVWSENLSGASVPCPQGIPVAVRFSVLGEGERFLALGYNLSDIKEMSEIYAKEKFDSQPHAELRIDPSPVGWQFQESDLLWTVYGPNLYGDGWVVISCEDGDVSIHCRRVLSLQELEQKGARF